MSSTGIEGLYIETHNWGKTVAFWTALGFELEFETDHHSGQLRHPAGGPFLFVAERPEDHELELQPILGRRTRTGSPHPRAERSSSRSPPSTGTWSR